MIRRVQFASPSRGMLAFLMATLAVVSWLPWQAAIYPAPYLIALIFFVAYASAGEVRPAILTGIPVLLLLGVVLLSGLIGLLHGATLLHPLFWFITHSSFALALVGVCLPRERGDWLLRLVLQVNIGLGCMEALVGAYQFIQAPSFEDSSAAGDYIVGTLGTNSHLYAIKMLLLASLSFLLWRRGWGVKYFVAFLLLLQAWLVASAMHTVLIAAMAFAFYSVLSGGGYRQAVRKIGAMIFLVFLTLLSLYWVQESNINYLLNKLSLINPADPYGGLFGKVALVYRTLVLLPQELGFWAVMFGVGAGAYSSRASWLLSGDYLQSQGSIPTAPSALWQQYMSDLWNKDLLEAFRWVHGVANQPMSSWVSILGELGYVGLGAILILFLTLLSRYRKAIMVCAESDRWRYEVALLTALIAGASMFFDNWIEYPQFMMLVVVVLALAYRLAGNEIARRDA